MLSIIYHVNDDGPFIGPKHVVVYCKLLISDKLCVFDCMYEGTSKSFRTFIFSLETVRAVGIVIGRV
jgi:hypothetical protein